MVACQLCLPPLPHPAHRAPPFVRRGQFEQHISFARAHDSLQLDWMQLAFRRIPAIPAIETRLCRSKSLIPVPALELPPHAHCVESGVITAPALHSNGMLERGSFLYRRRDHVTLCRPAHGSQRQRRLVPTHLFKVVADAFENVSGQLVCRILPERGFRVSDADPRPAGSGQESLCDSALIDSFHASKHASASDRFKHLFANCSCLAASC